MQKVLILAREQNIKSFSFFARGTVSDTFKFLIRETFVKFKRGTKNSIKHEGHFCHAIVHPEGLLGCYAFCDGEYPPRVAYKLISRCLMAFYKEVGNDWK